MLLVVVTVFVCGDSVTLAWSSQDDLTQLLKLAYPSFTIPLETIGFGVVGDHGTVIRNSDVATWSWH